MTPLLKPFLLGLRHNFMPGGRLPAKTLAIMVVAALIFAALFLASVKTVSYFHSQNELGVILSLKIFEMAWVIVFTMLIFSSMVSGVSAIFLSRDNEIVFASPASLSELYLMRYLTTTLYTSWMMIVFSFPVFGAFGQVFKAGPVYFLIMIPAVISIASIGTGIGLMVTITLVNLFPARRTKDIVVYLSLLFGILLYLVIRLLRPEELADPWHGSSRIRTRLGRIGLGEVRSADAEADPPRGPSRPPRRRGVRRLDPGRVAAAAARAPLRALAGLRAHGERRDDRGHRVRGDRPRDLPDGLDLLR